MNKGNFFRQTVSMLFVAAIMLFAAVSHAQIYIGEGSYCMSEGENLSVAKERAKADAMRSACEQAGVYVEGRTIVLNAQVTKDEIVTMTSNIIKLIMEPKFHPLETLDNLEGVMIRVTVKAEIDDADINKWLSKSDKEKSTLTSQMEALRKANEEQERQIAELKRQLAAKPQDREQITKKFEAEDKIFLSNQKLEEAWKLYEKNYYNDAVNLFNEALELNPNNELAYYGRGTAFGELRQYGRSIQDFDRAIGLNPNLSEAYTNRGVSYCIQGQNELAIKDYSKAIELNPNNDYAYTNRGGSYATLGQYERAIQDYNKAIQLNPNLAQAYVYRGSAYGNLRQYEQALRDFERAYELNPNDDNAKKGIELCHRAMGR